jgi:hypothetical protein
LSTIKTHLNTTPRMAKDGGQQKDENVDKE